MVISSMTVRHQKIDYEKDFGHNFEAMWWVRNWPWIAFDGDNKIYIKFCERYPLKVVHRIVDKIYKLEMRPYFYGSGSWKWFSNNLKKRIKYKQYFFQNNLTMSTWFEFKLHYFDMSRKILNLLQTDSCIYFSWTFSKLFFLCG